MESERALAEEETTSYDLSNSTADMFTSYDLEEVTEKEWKAFNITDNDLSTWIYLVCLFITTLVGNLGNIMVVGAMFSDKRLWKEANIFILNLAVADLCVTAFVDPFSIAGVFIGAQWFLDRSALCQIIGSICLVSCVCSLWSIAAISLNRYVLLAKPQYYHRIFTWQNTIWMVVALWIGAFMLDLPNFLHWGNHTYDMKTMACSYDRLASYSYTIFFITMFVTIPLLTVLYCNIGIYGVVLRSKRRVAAHLATKTSAKSSAVVHETVDQDDADSMGESTVTQETNVSHISSVENSLASSDTTQKKQVKRKRKSNTKNDIKLAKTLFIVFIVFCLCWAPYAILCLVDRHDRVAKEAYAFSILSAHTSSTLNSILYAVTNKSFRQGYKLFWDKIVTCNCSWPPK